MKRCILVAMVIFVSITFSACGLLGLSNDDANHFEGAMDFEARIIPTDIFASDRCASSGKELELPEYPIIIKSMNDIVAYLEFYNFYIRWSFSNEPVYVALEERLFSEYTEEFFTDYFLILMKFEECSSGNELRVDAVLENGDIHVTRILKGVTTDTAGWHIVLELSNSIAPEQFNLIIETVQR